jgi:hypothetical protein
MDAFCSAGQFEISPYLSQTDDWARTPDGKYYSNKPPGTLFLAAPVYCPVLALAHATTVQTQWKLRYVLNFLLCLLFQILPWIWLCGRWDVKLQEMGASPAGRTYARVALLFGTTPAVLMNVWIGNSLVAFFSLLALLAIFEERAVLVGFALGMMQLTEYSSLLVIPAVLLTFPAWRTDFPRTLGKMALGALLPAALWIYYHESTFGGAFKIANQFQNPLFQDQLAGRIQLWGIFTLPSLEIAAKLLFGWWRGILFSQPWVLLAAFWTPLFLRQGDATRHSCIYASVGLLALFVMNSSFGGWHGGSAAGPRYLSAALPIFAIPVALYWENFSKLQRKLLRGALAFSCLVFFLAMIFSPTAGLWPEWIGHFQEKPWDFVWKACVELLIVILIYNPLRISS